MTESIIAQIASESLSKPTSSVIDALLAPKLARLRQWATERDLLSQISEARLQKAFEGYLRRLLRRVSGVQTLVFPQQTLALPAAYEPLSLRERHSSRPVHEGQLLPEGTRSYIIDGAGMGKSTFARHLIFEELARRDRIPLLMELRRIESGASLFSAMAQEFDGLGHSFDSEVLLRLLSVGRFLIVLDGFDEVPADLRPRVSKDIEILASMSEKSSLVLTTRPEIVLPLMPDARALEFKPLETTQAESLVRRYDRVAGLEVGARLVLEFERVPNRFLETPLLVALLYRTYGFNGSISTKVSAFYDEMFAALYKGHDLSKSGFSRVKSSGLDFEDFRRLLRAFCFLVIVRQRNSFSTDSSAMSLIEEATQMITTKPSSASSFLTDLLLAVPLMVRDGSELRFAHKTIAEFFTAEYVSYSRNANSILENILAGPLRNRLQPATDFIADIDPLLYRRLVAAPLGKAALNDGRGSFDPLLRSLLFLGQSSISLWPQAEVFEEDGQLQIPPPPVPAPGQLYFYGSLGSEEYILSITQPTSDTPTPIPAWSLITEPAGIVSKQDHMDHIFDGLEEHLPLRAWVDLQDVNIQRISRHPVIVDVLRVLLNWTLRSGMGRGSKDATIRVISDSAIHELIESVREEQHTDKWLEELLKG